MHNNSDVLQPLSKRQCQCLAFLALGMSVQGLAHELGISPRTVEKHITSARKKIGAATREQAVVIAVTRNLLPSSATQKQD